MTSGATFVLYRCYDKAGRLIYVGSTSSYRRRLSEHLRHSWWYSLTDRLATRQYPSLEAARAAEEVAIQEEQPVFNTACTGRAWLARRDHWTEADHASCARWHDERGTPVPSLAPFNRAAWRTRAA